VYGRFESDARFGFGRDDSINCDGDRAVGIHFYRRNRKPRPAGRTTGVGPLTRPIDRSLLRSREADRSAVYFMTGIALHGDTAVVLPVRFPDRIWGRNQINRLRNFQADQGRGGPWGAGLGNFGIGGSVGLCWDFGFRRAGGECKSRVKGG